MIKKILFATLLFSTFTSFGFAKYGVWGLNNINIVSREERGADESLRMSENSGYNIFKKAQMEEEQAQYEDEIENSYKTNPVSTTPKKSVNELRNEYLQNNFLNDIKIDNAIKTIGGKQLWWEQDYHYDKTKLIIHHTTNPNSGLENKQDVMNLLQAVYKDHALRNGWGDIGYNFVIDKFGNIYEGRSGGAGVVGAHASRNNTDSIGIALIGNFNNEQPTESAMNSLVQLLTELSRKYNINPYDKKTFHMESSVAPYLKDVKEDSIVGHKDTKATACPGKNLYSRMSEIKNRVSRALQKGYDLTAASSSTYLAGTNTESVGTAKSNFTASSKMDEINIPQNEETTANYSDTGSDLDSLKSAYITKTGFKTATTSMKKISYKISLDEAQKLMKQNVKVMLYEASTILTGRNIACQSGCTIFLDGTKYSNIKTLNISQSNGKLTTTIESKKYTFKEINIYGGNGLISISNYNRKSYAGVPRNLFRGNIHIKKDKINILGTGVKNQYVVINEVGFDDYMRGIGEISEKQSIEKIKAMSLIIKDYVLFYINKKNTHPSIPVNVSYNAVDDARIFQKYVGYGYEGVSKKWFDALAVTKNQIILYNNYVPILPYFNCSAGFTWSGQEKYGWTDTPYLVSQLDFAKCDNFKGHGVGLSGEGAQKMAENGKNYKDIINYYYKGMTIKDLK